MNEWMNGRTDGRMNEKMGLFEGGSKMIYRKHLYKKFLQSLECSDFFWRISQEDLSTPLHLACSQGNLEITKLLVNHGAKIEREDGDGLTPLLR